MEYILLIGVVAVAALMILGFAASHSNSQQKNHNQPWFWITTKVNFTMDSFTTCRIQILLYCPNETPPINWYNL
jgi:Pyruvate/2-oxoacid:ferredoxin oxidoreductase delta subunit